MSNAAVRVRRLRDLVRSERSTIKAMSLKLDGHLQAVEALAGQLRQDRKTMSKRIKDFDARLKQLDEWSKEPVVLIRTSVGGYGLPVYHDARNPCGYMWRRASFKSMLLAEAEEAGHRPCSSCGHQANRRRLAPAA
jgi:hypothetical protein